MNLLFFKSFETRIFQNLKNNKKIHILTRNIFFFSGWNFIYLKRTDAEGYWQGHCHNCLIPWTSKILQKLLSIKCVLLNIYVKRTIMNFVCVLYMRITVALVLHLVFLFCYLSINFKCKIFSTMIVKYVFI